MAFKYVFSRPEAAICPLIRFIYPRNQTEFFILPNRHMNLSNPIPLPFTSESFVRLLQYGANPNESPYSHKQIAEWCDKFWCRYIDIDIPAEIEAILPILTDVETQWDLHLANTFTVEQLRCDSFEVERMPVEWFNDWLDQVLKLKTKINS
ncbi:hypothetical protein ACIPF8_21070 [Collimonas sp. NPDC087041]|uniref:hypothetical protein n=1 Tax=Collimonas sp. NPDC087041 TaxID=3363960 RepID=UPI0038151218